MIELQLIISVFQVFDSGSSCSNEECWELDKEGSKVKVSTVQSSLATSSSSQVSNPTNNSQTSDKVRNYTLDLMK